MNIERLYCMHKRIESEKTGTPGEFAKEFNIKTRQLLNQIEELRLMGAFITYSRARKTYYYTESFNFFEDFDHVQFIRTMDKKTMIELIKFHLKVIEKSAEK